MPSNIQRKYTFSPDPFAVVRFETPEFVANLRADAVATYQPVNSQELFAVERIALAQLALLRVATVEAGLFTNMIDDAVSAPEIGSLAPELTKDTPIALAQHRAFWTGTGFRRVAGKTNAIQVFLRYQAQSERLYRRAVEEFERLRALRSELPEQPVYPPEEPKPEPAPEVEPTPEPQGQSPIEPTGFPEPPEELRFSPIYPCGRLPQRPLPVTPFSQPSSENVCREIRPKAIPQTGLPLPAGAIPARQATLRDREPEVGL